MAEMVSKEDITAELRPHRIRLDSSDLAMIRYGVIIFHLKKRRSHQLFFSTYTQEEVPVLK